MPNLTPEVLDEIEKAVSKGPSNGTVDLVLTHSAELCRWARVGLAYDAFMRDAGPQEEDEIESALFSALAAARGTP